MVIKAALLVYLILVLCLKILKFWKVFLRDYNGNQLRPVFLV